MSSLGVLAQVEGAVAIRIPWLKDPCVACADFPLLSAKVEHLAVHLNCDVARIRLHDTLVCNLKREEHIIVNVECVRGHHGTTFYYLSQIQQRVCAQLLVQREHQVRSGDFAFTAAFTAALSTALSAAAIGDSERFCIDIVRLAGCAFWNHVGAIQR